MLERDFGYRPPISDELRILYEAHLDQTYRWKGGNWRKDIVETDWQHVYSMFEVLQDLNKTCPTLSSDVDIQTVQHMIYVHDQGEISVGDLTHNRHDYAAQYGEWKRKEYIAGKWQLRKIKDRDIRLKATELYDRCFNIRDYDKEALLTDFIDKIQGSRFGFRNVFHHGKGVRKANREMQFNHTVELLAKPVKPLLKLVSPSTQEGLKNFLREELERFSQYGYIREAAPYVKNLSLILR